MSYDHIWTSSSIYCFLTTRGNTNDLNTLYKVSLLINFISNLYKRNGARDNWSEKPERKFSRFREKEMKQDFGSVKTLKSDVLWIFLFSGWVTNVHYGGEYILLHKEVIQSLKALLYIYPMDKWGQLNGIAFISFFLYFGAVSYTHLTLPTIYSV